MLSAPVPPSRLAALGAFLAALIVQRVLELARSARHERALRARGAREWGAGHFPLFVALHALFPAALAAEVLWGGARPGALWPMWLGLVLAAQGLRVAVQHALGERWTVRVLVVPGLPLVTRGPYRFLRHPNYLAASIELLAGAALFGAWRTAIAATALNAVALAIRIPVEERAIESARAAGPAGARGPAATSAAPRGR
jgi:methyltransferase